jgi:hypothetical protein
VNRARLSFGLEKRAETVLSGLNAPQWAISLQKGLNQQTLVYSQVGDKGIKLARVKPDASLALTTLATSLTGKTLLGASLFCHNPSCRQS